MIKKTTIYAFLSTVLVIVRQFCQQIKKIVLPRRKRKQEANSPERTFASCILTLPAKPRET